MQIATALFLSTMLVLASCGGSKKRSDTADADVASNGCVTDISTGRESAESVAMGDKAVGMICPRGDQDYFLVKVGAGTNLLDVNLAYPSAVSKVALQVRLYEADGVTQVVNGLASDTNTGDGKSAVVTSFAVPTPGDYILRVSDASDAASDSVNSYVLQVTAAADSDTHEPNDTAAQAKPADGAPGFFSYVGDVDVYQVTLAPTSTLLQMKVTNPAAAKTAIEFEIADSTGKVVGTGKVPPAATPLDLTRAAPATGTLFVSFHYPAGSAPDRRPEAGYTVVLGGVAETDANEQPTRNDTPATATCLAGAGTPCAASFASSLVAFKSQTGSIASRGDRDYFFFRATAAPAVVEATLKMPPTAMDMALDILVPDLASPCKADGECKVLTGSCKTDDDCEWSHQCVAASAGACATATCRQCLGAGLCLPLPDSPGKSACGVTIFSTRQNSASPKTGVDGMNVLRTAQPVFNAGPVYVVVHDSQDDQYDPSTSYTLDVRVSPEPDPMDNGTDPASRNNFYNSSPLQDTNLEPNQKRAKDISAQISAGTSVSGYISYQSDEDWFWFTHPCQGKDCGLVFEWVQPGPSPVQPAFFMRTQDLTIHESWTYTGTLPAASRITDQFGDGNCTECSFASAKHGVSTTDASPATPYKYYLQIRDMGADDWDFAETGRYEFRLKTVTPGCPASCTEAGPGTCGYFCKAQN
jgi:hypothetical protein